MNRNVFASTRRHIRRRAVVGSVLGTLLLYLGATAIGDVSEEAKRRGSSRPDFGLFASASFNLTGNQLSCGLINDGTTVCGDESGSGTVPGGFWPKNSPNSYIYNTGLQIGSVVGADGGAWAGDTASAFFFDSKGLTEHGQPLSSIYQSLNPADLDVWGQDAVAPADPARAIISDTDIFAPALIGQKAASQQDSWVAYWDGNPNFISGRGHPVGVMVYQRSMAWNYPSGNESVIYFIYTFKNVTDTQEFQVPNEAAFFGGDNALPDDGWTISRAYAAFGTDMDVGAQSAIVTTNFSTAILPFDMGISYIGPMGEPNFVYPSELFFPPFFTNAPGIVGVKYLKSPLNPDTGEEVGLTLFGITDNQGNFFGDANDDKQLYRYLSGVLDPSQGDQSCNVLPEVASANAALVERSVCFVAQSSADTRFFQASGPFELAAGQEGTIVVSYIITPTVATMPNGDPSGIIVNSSNANENPPGEPSFHPGFSSRRGCDANGQNCAQVLSNVENAVKAIERGAGWVQYNGPPPSGRGGGALESPENKYDQNLVEVVPGSMLGRGLVAQSVFNNKFLLGFAPVAPLFQLIPGDGQVTVIWEPSTTEAEGDPFFAVAGDPSSALYNPNYRQFDVEGYRIFRQTLAGEAPVLLSQFDYGDTDFPDVTCETIPPDEGTGYVVGDPCTASTVRPIDGTLIFNNGAPGGPPGGGVVRLVDGTALGVTVLGAIEDGLPSEPLNDRGVPFAFVDDGVTNNFAYIYSVEAFDVNSSASGPQTLRSARNEIIIVPRVFASNVDQPFSFAVLTGGDDGVALDTDANTVQPDPDTGVFPGPQPPTNNADVFTIPGLAAAGPLLEAGEVSIRIDSVIPLADADNPCPAGSNARGMCWKMYVTSDNGVTATASVVDGFTPFSANNFGESDVNFPVGSSVLPFSDTELEKYDIPAGFGEGVTVGVGATVTAGIVNSAGEALQCRFDEGTADCEPGGSRWFDGDTETNPHPTVFTQAGSLAGVDSIFHPISHTAVDESGAEAPSSGDMVCWPYTMSFLGRAADVRFEWAGGTFGVVRDVTHNVDIRYNPDPQAGTWGFMNTDANGNGVIDWQDFDYLDAMNQNTNAGPNAGLGFFCALGDRGLVPPIAKLDNAPQFQPTSTSMDQPEGMPTTGTGFGIYVNGEHYIFEMGSAAGDGTVWTLRTYFGFGQATPRLSSTPSNYTVLPASAGLASNNRPNLIPSLSYIVQISEAGTQLVGKPDLTTVHTVPDPYLASSQYDLGTTEHRIQFVNLPAVATIRIYTLTGILVDVVDHEDASGGGRAEWDLRNRNNNFIASGVYFFNVATPDGDEYVGKFTVVNFGAQN